MKTLELLETDLRLMRQEATDYALDPMHDSVELPKRKSECWNLSGAIDCFKRGEMPVLPSQAKYLRDAI